MFLEVPLENLVSDSRLIDYGLQGSPWDILTLGNDDEAHNTGRFTFRIRAVTAFPPIRCFDKSQLAQYLDYFTGRKGRKTGQAAATSSGAVKRDSEVRAGAILLHIPSFFALER